MGYRMVILGNGLLMMVICISSVRGKADIPLGGGPGGLDGIKIVPTNGITARLDRIADADAGKPAVKVTFTKSDDTRRFLALEARPSGYPVNPRSVALRYRLQLTKGNAPRLAMILYAQGGGSWFKVGGQALEAANTFTDGRLSLTALRQTAFSEDVKGQLAWDQIGKVWIGLILDGPAEGTFEVSQARLTTEPYKPTQPLRITGVGPGSWSLAADGAVLGKITTPNEGPDGKPCMKFEFTMPGHRHMYALPTTSIPSAELDGYTALRFTYKAALPPGISGLLVTLAEQGGGQYYADPAPPASANWSTITIPFDKFKFASWSKDQNDKLDIDEVGSIIIGMHGAGNGDTVSGTISATDVEFIP